MASIMKTFESIEDILYLTAMIDNQQRGAIQGTLHFSYNGETLADLRNRLEEN